MVSLFKWFEEEENRFFAFHALFVLVAAILSELLLSQWTTFALPAILLVAVVSFLVNYPVQAIKAHGLFSEYLIELRLLWLVILGVFSEYIVFQLLENGAISLYAAAALLIGIVVLFYARSHLHEKIVKARGFN